MPQSKVNKYQGQVNMEISVSDFVLRNLGTGVESYINTVQSESLNKSVSTEKIKGGVNNDTIASIDGDTTIELEITTALSYTELTQAKWGATEATGVIVETCFPNNYIVATGKVITLPQSPLDSNEVIVYKGSTPLAPVTDYTISDKVITIKAANIAEGDTLFVSSFRFTGTSNTYFDAGVGSNSLVFEVLQKKPIFDSNMQIVKWKYTHYPKCTMSSEVDSKADSKRSNQPMVYKFSVEKSQNYPYLFRTYYR